MMQHAWFFALLALPAARAVACACDEWRNGATAEDPALCRKGEVANGCALRTRTAARPAAAAAGGAVERAAGEAEHKPRICGSARSSRCSPTT